MFKLDLRGKAADVLLATLDTNTVVTGLVPAGRSRSCFPKKETTKQSICITESLIQCIAIVLCLRHSQGEKQNLDTEINVLELKVPLSRRPYGQRHLVSILFCSSTPTQS
jgi:hypothetical protein